ncbi:MAG: class I SAM-dependent methyltransferase [Erythrobacter tepidarius]
MTREYSGYEWKDAHLTTAHGYLLPTLLELLASEARSLKCKRVFDLGCGNGSVANVLAGLGWDVTGVDPSEQGIALANSNFPHLNLLVHSAYEDLKALYGQFPVVISLEVVEHVYYPRKYAATLFSLLEEGGLAIVSTPYHGYLKNLALAVTGKMDAHFTALWDHGHIKFWSISTLKTLLQEAGFDQIAFWRVGRIPPLAKSMFAIARKRA